MFDSIDMTRRAVLSRGLAVMLAAMAGAGAARAQAGDPRQPVTELCAVLQNSMKLGARTPFQQRFDLIAAVVDRVLDLETILRVSVGPRWSTMDETGRKSLAGVFRAFTIASYAANFDKDGGDRFEVVARVRGSGTDQIVESRLIVSDGAPIRIDYLMRETGGVWRVVDVLLDGSISRVAVQRSDFRGLLASDDPAPLIASLSRKVAELSGGALRPAGS